MQLKDHQRYYLHRKVKEFARIEARGKKGIIYLPHNADLQKKHGVYISRLQAIGYSVQFEIC